MEERRDEPGDQESEREQAAVRVERVPVLRRNEAEQRVELAR